MVNMTTPDDMASSKNLYGQVRIFSDDYGYRRVSYIWYRQFLTEFVSSFTGLALSIIGVATFLMKGIQEHS